MAIEILRRGGIEAWEMECGKCHTLYRFMREDWKQVPSVGGYDYVPPSCPVCGHASSMLGGTRVVLPEPEVKS